VTYNSLSRTKEKLTENETGNLMIVKATVPKI